jgi:hypothetical protein
VSALLLDEKILALEQALTRAEVPHAFGGALALAYYATPRATIDIDLNVFLPTAEAERVLAALTPLGVASPSPEMRSELAERGQARLFWEHTPIDLFFAYDPLHDRCMERTRRAPFGDGETIPVLSAEDLAIFKTIFDRAKDWRDLRELFFALAGDFDDEYALGWLRRILAADDQRLLRFQALLCSEDSES